MHPQSLRKACNIQSTFTVNLHDFTDTAPQPIASSDEPDFKPKRAKRKTPLYRMKMLLDLKKVKEEEEAIPHIPSMKEWRKQEKKREKEEAKKAVKREKQLKKEHKLKAGVYIVRAVLAGWFLVVAKALSASYLVTIVSCPGSFHMYIGKEPGHETRL